ncbi:hypothetical protein VCSRO12_0243 [Vibrio cholerae]|uniref:hypothetical protein n=1 Tax=Vibrio cholerae TaxID=666 RepID=UPI000E6C3099|nr:hypothetical protein [Vibrio cholerae]EKF9080221.1 hypothetical protein [Vibrio cholerae]TXZ89560.1 hypothetical protein FXE42_13755 [Vibrio cholerae]GHY58633.1 hypothetical protein VCSRO12_0243 [Vibrio cholerae]HDI3168866.1 hypothetical protein [Vibrio cholerae]HDI3187029.1 hypothetical protein [Vibrio cholerae]
MAFEIGTALNHRDLLRKIKSLAELNGWTTVMWNQGVIVSEKPAEGVDELILHSTGNSGVESIYLAFKTVFDASKDLHNIHIFASPMFSANANWDSQPLKCRTHVTYWWQNTINYAICLDKDHIKVTGQVSTTTRAFYLGKLELNCSLGHWPRHLIVCGEGIDTAGTWRTKGQGFSTFQCMYGQPIDYLWIDGQWKSSNSELYVFPRQLGAQVTDRAANYSDGNTWTLPMMLLSKTHKALGSFKDCYWIPGDRISTGQQFKSPDLSRTMIAMQNIDRSAHTDFMAWELK